MFEAAPLVAAQKGEKRASDEPQTALKAADDSLQAFVRDLGLKDDVAALLAHNEISVKMLKEVMEKVC